MASTPTSRDPYLLDLVGTVYTAVLQVLVHVLSIVTYTRYLSDKGGAHA